MEVKLLKPEQFAGIDEEEIKPIEVKDLRKGDIFYEGNAVTENFELIVCSNPRKKMHGWAIRAKKSNGDEIDIYVSDNSQYPKPEFYTVPQDIIIKENGECLYQVY